MRWQTVAVFLAVALMLAVPLQGQRASGGVFRGGMPGGWHGPVFGAHPGLVGHPFPNLPFRGNFRFNHFRNFGGFGGVWLPWSYPWDYWDYPWDYPDWHCNRDGDSLQSYESQAGLAQNGSAAPVSIARSAPQEPALPPEPPKMIEVPLGKESPPAKPFPPTLFVLANGNRLEARRYMLTVDSLYVEVGREERRVPVSELDLQQTVAANHQRGIDIKVPNNASEIFVGF